MKHLTMRAAHAVLIALTALTLAGGLTATAHATWKEDPDDCYSPPRDHVCPWSLG